MCIRDRFGAVTSTNPVYTTATSEPLSLSQIGALRADATAWGGTAVSAPTVFGVSPISSSGTTSTYATTGASSPSALAFDSSGNAWVGGNNGVVQLSPTGTILQTLSLIHIWLSYTVRHTVLCNAKLPILHFHEMGT